MARFRPWVLEDPDLLRRASASGCSQSRTAALVPGPGLRPLQPRDPAGDLRRPAQRHRGPDPQDGPRRDGGTAWRCFYGQARLWSPPCTASTRDPAADRQHRGAAPALGLSDTAYLAFIARAYTPDPMPDLTTLRAVVALRAPSPGRARGRAGRPRARPQRGRLMARATASGQPGALVYFTRKVARHVRWARTEGIGRLIEEDRLDPRGVWPPPWRKAAGAAAIRSFRAPPLRSTSSASSARAPTCSCAASTSPGSRCATRTTGRCSTGSSSARTTFSHRRSVPAGTPLFLVKPLCSRTAWTSCSTCLGCPLGAPCGCSGAAARARSEVSKFRDANLRALRAIAAGGGVDLAGPAAARRVGRGR